MVSVSRRLSFFEGVIASGRGARPSNFAILQGLFLVESSDRSWRKHSKDTRFQWNDESTFVQSQCGGEAFGVRGSSAVLVVYKFALAGRVFMSAHIGPSHFWRLPLHDRNHISTFCTYWYTHSAVHCTFKQLLGKW